MAAHPGEASAELPAARSPPFDAGLRGPRPSPPAIGLSHCFPISMPAKPSALVVGVSDYPPSIGKLPAVAADAREVIKLLGSGGADSQARIVLLEDAAATRDKVLGALRDILANAGRDETVCVYFAGHGASAPDGSYYFIPCDGDGGDLAATGVPLAEVRRLFENSPGQRLLMFLDFCHSGGILARGLVDQEEHDATAAVARTLQVVQGQGRIILCACTAEQLAYESNGHGHFTRKILAGLRGAAVDPAGEVTISSLHD